MRLSWKERINKLDEFKPFSRVYLDDKIYTNVLILLI